MSGMILALAVWFILKALEVRRHEVPEPCLNCYGMIVWDGRRYVHEGGSPTAFDEPSHYLPEFDDERPSHLATPIT